MIPPIDYTIPTQGTPLMAYIGLAVFMFCVGMVGVIIRRNPIVIFMSIELMLNSVNLTFVAFARFQPYFMGLPSDQVQGAMAGQMMVIFVMAVAAAEVAVGLGIIMAIYRIRNTIDIDEMNLLKG
jgi:NADH-quinone oxidoreductase subunit K